MLSATSVLALAAVGVVSGFLAGLLGIGGGILIVPFLTAILSVHGVPSDLAVKVAIATSMGTIMFTSISSVRAHHRRGTVRWDLVRRLAPGIVAGSVIASMGVFAVVKGSTLSIIFALFVGASATQMLWSAKSDEHRRMPGRTGTVAAGGAIGLLSGLVGAGGGSISVPFMTWCNVAIREAVATSAALGFPIAVANVTGYIVSGLRRGDLPSASIGYVWLPALFVIAAGSMSTAPLGARVAHAIPMVALRRLFATILLGVAAHMLYRGLA